MKQIIKTYPGVNDGLWLDVTRVGPGQYQVEIAGSEPEHVIAYGFILPIHAEEFVVDLQARQRGWVRVG